MAEIVLDGISKKFADGFEAVKDLNLEIADGEFMILVGPSGCGKSTALRMIAGLEDITEGELKIGGNVVNERAPKDRDIAMVFQNYALYPHMSVRENMAFPLRLAGRRRRGDQEGRGSGEGARPQDHLDRKPANLSGGQRQRVAMGRAIVRDPSVFLMDEPLSNLDAKLRVQMRTEVSRLQADLGTTTVYVTHDQTEAMTLGDRVAVMRAGVLQQVGTPADLYNEPNNLFVAGFIGSPAMNFMAATIEGGRVKLPFGEVELPSEHREKLGSHSGKVIAGVRPESFEDAGLVGDAKGPRHHVHRQDRPRRVHGLREVRVLLGQGRVASSPRSSRSWPRTRAPPRCRALARASSSPASTRLQRSSAAKRPSCGSTRRSSTSSTRTQAQTSSTNPRLPRGLTRVNAHFASC